MRRRAQFSAWGSSGPPSPRLASARRPVANAPVTIEEWADFQCPACGQFARLTEPQLLSTYGAKGQVSIVFHHFAFLGQESSWAAEAAECAGEQGKFFEFHDALYSSQAGENRGAFSKDNLKKLGRHKVVRASLEGREIAAIVAEDDEVPTDPKVRFDPAGINVYAGSWRVEMGA